MTRSDLRNSTPSSTTVPSSGAISRSAAVFPPGMPRPMMRLPSAGSSFSLRFQPPPCPLPPKPPPLLPPPKLPPAPLSAVCGLSFARALSTSRYSCIERSISFASRNARKLSSSSASSFSKTISMSKPKVSLSISRNFCATFSLSCAAATLPSTGQKRRPSLTPTRFSTIALVIARYEPLRICTICGTYSLAASSADITKSRYEKSSSTSFSTSSLCRITAFTFSQSANGITKLQVIGSVSLPASRCSIPLPISN